MHVCVRDHLCVIVTNTKAGFSVFVSLFIMYGAIQPS